jgi:hypothetical protein
MTDFDRQNKGDSRRSSVRPPHASHFDHDVLG